MTTFTKLIEMQFIPAGKRTKFIGFIGQLTDESGIVLHSQLYDTKPQAEQALDTLMHDLLIDYAERGLIDTVPTLPTLTYAAAQQLAHSAARLTKQPWHVVNDGHFSIADDADVICYGYQALYTATPPFDDPLPDPGPGGPGVPGDERPLLADIAHVIDMALGNAPARDVIPQLRRIRARITDITTVCRL